MSRAHGVGSVLASAGVVLLWTTAAFAVSVTNRDDKEMKITVIVADAKTDHLLKPSQVLDGVCPKGCVIRLNDSENDEYILEGPESVSIESGYLYYDSAPDTGAPGPPKSGEGPPAP